MNSNIAKKTLYFLVIPTGQTTDHMTFKFFPGTTLLLKVDLFEGFSNQNKTNKMVNNQLSICNSQ